MVRAKDNPFSTDRILRERYRLDRVGWNQLQAHLQSLNRRGAIVGPHGSGKTTLLEDLAERLERDGWSVHLLRLSDDVRRFDPFYGAEWSRALGPRDFILLDGAEQLSWIRWRRFRHAVGRTGGLVITTHSSGRLPLLHRCSTTPELLCELSASLGQPLAVGDAKDLYTRFSGNLRDALRELYERAAHSERV